MKTLVTILAIVVGLLTEASDADARIGDICTGFVCGTGVCRYAPSCRECSGHTDCPPRMLCIQKTCVAVTLPDECATVDGFTRCATTDPTATTKTLGNVALAAILSLGWVVTWVELIAVSAFLGAVFLILRAISNGIKAILAWQFERRPIAVSPM